MNKTLVALIASGALLTVAACSSTRTQRAPGEQVDDAALLTSVKSALVSNTVTEAGEINVDVNRGTVKLSGFVDTQQEKSKAGDVARGVDGVKTVQNDIAVQTKNSSTGDAHRRLRLDRQGEDRADREPRKRRLTRSTSRPSRALCSFRASSTRAAAKTAATSVARSVTGVKDVKNELSVKSY